MRVLVTGATGYIGGRLVPRLLRQGFSVRVLVRDPLRVRSRAWVDEVEVIQADLLDPDSLAPAFVDVDVVYYLVHSMHSGADFDQQDRRAAENCCRFASSVRHLIYLGGLLPTRHGAERRLVSKHLLSRAEIGRILSRHFHLTEFRAGPIIGSGSASFEMLRYVTERLPVMIAPSWVRTEVSPIAVRDVLSYLIQSLEHGPCGVVEIGDEPTTYKDMMLAYAKLRGLRRWVIPIPRILPVWLGAGWIGFSTPIPRALAGPLMEGMALPLRARQHRARRCFPKVQPLRLEQALELALQRIEERAVETRWSGARTGATSSEYEDAEGLIRDVRSLHANAPPEAVYRVLVGLGGDRGWPTWTWAYWVRAAIDRLLGGPGLQRGRRHPVDLLPGEKVDFWRVDAAAAPRLLRLCGEIKFPGRVWLQWDVTAERGGARLTQTVTIMPRGTRGTLYWYSLLPIHRWFFARTIRAIRRESTTAESLESSRTGRTTPPVATRGFWGDVRSFFVQRPRVATLVEFQNQADRENYSHRIMHRLGLDVTRYSVLNLHRISIEAPVRSVFEELTQWNGHSSCWPNNIARVELPEGRLDDIQIRTLGVRRVPFGRHTSVGWSVPPLFVLKALRVQSDPEGLGTDNARYMLFSCSGGYPIGILVIYVRSSIAEQGESGRTQVFFGVGFDFYGEERLSSFRPLTKAWEDIHNRVTANVLNRFKQLCEWRFQRLRDGM